MRKRALLYLRQSDSDGVGDRSLSLDSQAATLRADADRFDWAVVAEIRDADLKGHDERRPGLLELYERVRAGDVEVVAFWKLDRLARLLRLQENVLHELSQLGVEVYSNQDPYIATPFFRQVLGAFNEELTRIIGANVRRALHERARRGLPHGVPPMGYRRTSVGGNYEIVPEEAKAVRHVFERRVAGAGDAQIARELADLGIVTSRGNTNWRLQTVEHIRKNRAYIGEVKFGTTTVPNCFPSIIERDLWERAQEPRPSNRRPVRPKPYASYLEGLIEHACGRPMYLFQACPRMPRPRFRCRYASARSVTTDQPGCPYSPRSADMETLESLVWELLVADFERVLDPDQVVALARREFERQAPTGSAQVADAQSRLQRAQARRNRAEDLYLSGHRDRQWFDAEELRVVADIAVAERDLADLPRLVDADEIARTWEALRELQTWLPSITSLEARAIALRAVGIAVIEGSSQRRGPGYLASARIKYHPNTSLFFASNVT